MASDVRPTIGLLVNPIAGMGGSVGLHGTDGEALLSEAIRRGAVPLSERRAQRAVQVLVGQVRPRWRTASGDLGASVLTALGMEDVDVVFDVPGSKRNGLDRPQDEPGVAAVGQTSPRTTAVDTVEAARCLAELGVDLLLFAGGDGTARDVLKGVGPFVPMLGVPCGVKMRSGVFTVGPEAAGRTAVAFLAHERRPVRDAEVVDVDAEGRSVLYGAARVPAVGSGGPVPPKSGTAFGSEAELTAVCEAVAKELDPETLYLFGPGTTTARVLAHLGVEKTLLGVDALLGGRIVGQDLAQVQILKLMKSTPRTRLILGVVGGQGFLLGRGNQQLGPPVLERVASEDLMVIASAAKLAALEPPVLWVEADDCGAVARFTGYRRVRVGPRRYLMTRVQAAA